MLVLTRKEKERIRVGRNIVITVLEIRGNRVRIGIDAPKEIHVLREELQHVNADAEAELALARNGVDL